MKNNGVIYNGNATGTCGQNKFTIASLTENNKA